MEDGVMGENGNDCVHHKVCVCVYAVPAIAHLKLKIIRISFGFDFISLVFFSLLQFYLFSSSVLPFFSGLFSVGATHSIACEMQCTRDSSHVVGTLCPGTLQVCKC